MNTATALREARQRAGLTQATLASRTGTSQATISAYESGRKDPSVETFSRLLSATGSRLTVAPERPVLVEPAASRLARSGRTLVEVLGLAAALPTRHEPMLRFPPLGRAR